MRVEKTVWVPQETENTNDGRKTTASQLQEQISWVNGSETETDTWSAHAQSYDGNTRPDGRRDQSVSIFCWRSEDPCLVLESRDCAGLLGTQDACNKLRVQKRDPVLVRLVVTQRRGSRRAVAMRTQTEAQRRYFREDRVAWRRAAAWQRTTRCARRRRGYCT